MTICALNTELEEAKGMLAYNHPLVSLGANLSRLNSIDKQLLSLAVERFHAMAQVVMPKSSPEAISLGGELIVAGLFVSICINNNKIISGIYN